RRRTSLSPPGAAAWHASGRYETSATHAEEWSRADRLVSCSGPLVRVRAQCWGYHHGHVAGFVKPSDLAALCRHGVVSSLADVSSRRRSRLSKLAFCPRGLGWDARLTTGKRTIPET